MQNNRFFAFGCSYTKYAWPTWADIVGIQYGGDYYNYGKHGAGNLYIHNIIMQADQHYRFNNNDLIIVQWSGIDREDRYLGNEWYTKGNVLSAYPENYLENYYDSRGFLIRDIALIKSIKEFLENKKSRYEFISMSPIKSLNKNVDDAAANKSYSTTDEDIYNFYADVFEKIKPSFFDILGIFNNRPYEIRSGVIMNDAHRLPFENYEYLKKVLPEYLPVNADELISDIQKQLIENWDPVHATWHYDWKIMGRNVKKLL